MSLLTTLSPLQAELGVSCEPPAILYFLMSQYLAHHVIITVYLS